MTSVSPSASLARKPGPGAGAPDTPGAPAVQGRVSVNRGIRTRTLLVLRTVLGAGQLTVLLVVWQVLRWPVRGLDCLTLVGASMVFNTIIAISPAAQRKGKPWEILGQLVFDTLQLAGLLYLTGGVINPFALMLITPVTIAGGALSPRYASALCALAMALALALAIFAPPASWLPLPLAGAYIPYRLGCAGALIVGMVFAAGYASWSSGESARKELALHVTETVLAREQRLSALGALAAAAAHELGTPLATITVVAKEMAREAADGPFADDAWLLVEQAQRCRDILKRLAETPERGDVVHERMTLLQLVREVVEPFAGSEDVRVEAVVTGPSSVAAPDLWRRPEVLHAVAAIVENAYDFARAEILVTARFDAATVAIEVRDDGPGFAPHVLAKLGEPYVTSRPGAEGSRTGHIGMGLGFFIAKTLLERTGARVEFRNGPKLGAIVTARWPRVRMEALETSL
jgi:two-component system, sensor histidine kinase RegB